MIDRKPATQELIDWIESRRNQEDAVVIDEIVSRLRAQDHDAECGD